MMDSRWEHSRILPDISPLVYSQWRFLDWQSCLVIFRAFRHDKCYIGHTHRMWWPFVERRRRTRVTNPNVAGSEFHPLWLSILVYLSCLFFPVVAPSVDSPLFDAKLYSSQHRPQFLDFRSVSVAAGPGVIRFVVGISHHATKCGIMIESR